MSPKNSSRQLSKGKQSEDKFYTNSLVVSFLVLIGVISLIILFVVQGYSTTLIINLGFQKPLWDWLTLILVPLLVPIIVGYGIWWLDKQEDERNKQNVARREEELQHRNFEQKSQETFQTFLDAMNQLLLEYHTDLFSTKHPARKIAQGRTKHALLILNSGWRIQLLQFLKDTELIIVPDKPTDSESEELVGLFNAIDLHHYRFRRDELNQSDFRHIKAKYYRFFDLNMNQVSMDHAQMENARIYRCRMNESDLSNANMAKVKIFRTKLNDGNFKQVILEQAVLGTVELEEADFSGARLADACFKSVNLRSANFSQADLSRSYMRNVDLTGANFSFARLQGSDFDDSTIQTLTNEWQIVWEILNQPQADRDLSGIMLSNANLENARLEGVSFEGASLTSISFVKANLTRANFYTAFLQEVQFQGSNLRWANWRETVVNPDELPPKERLVWEILNDPVEDDELLYLLSPSQMKVSGQPSTKARKDGRNLEGVDLSEVDLVGSNLQGAVLNGAILYFTELQNADLQNAKLNGAKLKGVLLNGANMTGAELKEAELQDATLDDAILEKAKLGNAKLQNANLKNVNLKNADLRGADLEGASLEGAILDGADLRGAIITENQLEKVLSKQNISFYMS